MAITRLGPNQDITAAKIAGTINFKNLIINGDMSLAQRGTSEAGITSSGYYTVDRWRIGIATGGTWTNTQSTDVPTGQGFVHSTKLDCTTANASLSGAEILYFSQRFEGQNLQFLKYGTSNAESLTLSFWVKSNKTGTYIVELYNQDSARNITNSYTINTADTWEKKTFTYAGDSTGTYNDDNNRSLDLNFWLVAGSNYSSGTPATSWGTTVAANRAAGQTVNLADSTDNEWYITGIQLEADTSASDFEFLPFDVNFKRCQRYFQKIDYDSGDDAVAFGYAINNSQSIYYYNFRNGTMRSAPSITTSSVSNGFRYQIAGAEDLQRNNIPNKDLISTTNVQFGNNQSTITANRPARMRMQSGAFINFDAEL